MEAIHELMSLVNKFGNNIDYYYKTENHYNEHSCRTEYIDSFLKILGWDISNKKGLPPQYREVIAENYSNKTDRPDYSMTLRGVTKFFVEAKKPAVDISTLNEPALQARKYGWNANHKITVLTNFEYLIIYDTRYVPSVNDNCSVARYRKYHYEEYITKFEEIKELLSRDNVYNGKFDEFCEIVLQGHTGQKQQVDELFLDQINHWRVCLSESLYNKDPKYHSMEKLNDVVQEFINQIVFLRICEDKNLPLYHKLKDTITNETLIKIKLEKLFRVADKKYNSGIFKGDTIIFDLDNNSISEIITELYYPQSPYLFNIIKPNLLGKMYEVFLTEKLSLENNKIILTKKKDCINKSAVTTPTEIVKYMVEKTLLPLCKDRTPKSILDLKIADIACGSGVFLEEAYDYLVQYCVRWYQENNPTYLIELSGGRKKLPLEEKKEILKSCIFGIDIDIHAVEVAKFSLLIKLIEDETQPSVEDSIPILPNLENNIMFGNSLIDRTEQKSITLTLNETMEIIPFEWSKINNGNFFDAIIGNPPYVNTEGMHSLLTKKEFDLYKELYTTTHKQFDKYFLFIERAIQKLTSGGYLCYIVPNKFFKIDSGQKLRKLISSQKLLVSLDDFGDTQLFTDKTIYSSIIVLQKTVNKQFNYAKVESLAALWAGQESNKVRLQSNILTELPWRLTTDIDFLTLLKEIDTVSVPITNHADIFNGIQTSAERPNPIYWFSQEQIIDKTKDTFTIEKDGQVYKIEKQLLRPYFKPTKKSEKGLNSYSLIQTDKWIIFPYHADGKLIDIDEMQTQYTGIYNYLNFYYDRLVPKQVDPKGFRDVPNSTLDTWYQYGRTQALTSFTNTPKLIVGILSKEPMYAYDDNDMLIASGGTAGYCAVTNKANSPYALEYLQAWLSNSHTEKILEMIGSDFENGFIARGTFVLATLPFIELDFTIPSQKELHDHVVADTQKIYEINTQLMQQPEKRVSTPLIRKKEQLIKNIKTKIDSVYRLEFNGIM